MIEMKDEDVIGFIESESMDKTATYLQSGRRLSGFNTEDLENSSIGILQRILEDEANHQDRILLSWIVAELNLRNDVRESFTKKFSSLCQRIVLKVDKSDLEDACEKSIQEYAHRLKNKN